MGGGCGEGVSWGSEEEEESEDGTEIEFQTRYSP
jgi:hypothetical protein